MTNTGTLTLVSCGLNAATLSSEYRAYLNRAAILAGGTRLLDAFPDFEGTRVVIGAHARDTAKELAEHARTKHVVILASGDALFFGIGVLFTTLVPTERLTILPNLTAAQAALVRLKISWSKTRFFTIHGRNPLLPWQTILQSQSAVIYADPTNTPVTIATQLMERYPEAGQREAAIVENLGADEHITLGTLASLTKTDCGGFAMLVLFPTSAGIPPVSLGLPDETYERENNLITHPEVRAVILSKLRLRRGVLWDLGAGSGSVGIEAAGLCEGLLVHAVEQKKSRADMIAQNAATHGCPTVTVHNKKALDTLAELPQPNRIFIGGGGADISAIVTQAFARLKPGGILVASAVLLETKHALASLVEPACTEIIELDIKRSVPIGSGHMMKADNPVTVYVFCKTEMR